MKIERLVVLGGLVLISLGARAENVVTQQANEWEVNHCMETIKGLSNFIVDGRKHGAHGYYNKNKDSIYSSLVVVPRDAFLTSLMAVGPNAKSGCSGTYIKTAVLPKKCSIAKEEDFSKWEYEGSLANETLLLSSNNLNLYLTPAPKGTCLVQKREMLMQ